MSESDETVLATRSGGLVVLAFNRPARRNAMTPAMEQRYLEHLAIADADPEVRAIVVTGTAGAFCSGGDLGDLRDLAEGSAGSTPRDITLPMRLRKPLIGAVEGACAGIGFVHLLSCDVVFVASDAKLTTSFSRRGFVAERGVAWRLREVVGATRAADLLISGRMFDGVEAERIGLCHRALPAGEVLPAATAYANDLIASCSPRSIAVIKSQLRAAGVQDNADAIAGSAVHERAAFTHPDFREGVASFVEHRPPRFAPLPFDDDMLA